MISLDVSLRDIQLLSRALMAVWSAAKVDGQVFTIPGNEKQDLRNKYFAVE
ncbi:hypothetical protein [Zhihengliuella salsuginis]|uniref:hypothetical protein n=1 Tax=Zhihengliuella salsuginis TaxID=578222 RepID=UPI00167B99DB|nr:hypothetical protein [Zhihengliuella salsuginis]